MASARTLRKRAEQTRTWTTTTLCPDGVWRQQPYNLHLASEHSQARKIRLPGKMEREARRLAAKGTNDGQEDQHAEDAEATVASGDEGQG